MTYSTRVLALLICAAFLGLGLLPLLGAAGQASAETILVSYTVEPYLLLELTTPSIVFPPVAPGEIVEQTVEAVVKANVPWNLRIVGTLTATTADGSIVDMYSRLSAYSEFGLWEQISGVTSNVVFNHPPTDSSGIQVKIPLRLEGDFNDPPGTYQTELQLILVPQI